MKRARRFVELLRTQPDYIFGRFLLVRRLYSAVQRVRGSANVVTLRVARVYEPAGDNVPVAHSGLVESIQPVTTHVGRLRDAAWSNGITLVPSAVAALRMLADTTRLMFNTSASQVTFAPSLAALTPEQRNGIALAQIADAWQNSTVQAIAGDEHIVAVVPNILATRPPARRSSSSGASPAR